VQGGRDCLTMRFPRLEPLSYTYHRIWHYLRRTELDYTKLFLETNQTMKFISVFITAVAVLISSTAARPSEVDIRGDCCSCWPNCWEETRECPPDMVCIYLQFSFFRVFHVWTGPFTNVAQPIGSCRARGKHSPLT
jgi:hypothetical protein